MDKFFYPDDEPPRRSLRERAREVRQTLEAGRADAARGIRAEWRNLTAAYPWIVRRRKLLLAGIAAVLVGVPGLLWLAITSRMTSQMPTGLRTRVLLDAPGRKLHPALSADGKRIAFVWDGGQPGGNYDIYVMSTAAEDKGKPPQRITSHAANDLRPSWSPDGARLAFIRNTPEEMSLMMVTVDQHEETKLRALVPKGWYVYASDPLMSNVNPGPEWSADGSALFVTDARNTEDGVPLWRVDLITSEREQLTHPGELMVDLYPQRARSGNELAFLRRANSHSAEAFAVDAGTGRERQITSESYDLRGAVLMPNGRDLIISSDEGGKRSLRYYRPKEGVTTRLELPGDYAFDPVWTGKMLAWTAVRASWSLSELPLEMGEPPEGERSLKKLPSPRGRNHSPAFSPDGQELLWVSDAEGPWEMWKASADGSWRRLSRFGPTWGSRFLGSPAWSPDGRRVAFEARRTGNAGIALTDPAAAAVRLMEENVYNEERPTWSNDGKWVYYGTDRDQVLRIWRRQAAGGQPVRVTSKEGWQAFESFDGSTLYYVPGPLAAGIWRMPVNGGEEKMLPNTEPYFLRGHWAVGPRGAYFMGYDAQPRTLFYYRFATETVEPVLTLPRPLPADVPAMAVNRAGTRLVLAQEDEYSSEILIADR